MTDTEGKREIEAAKQRLAAAKRLAAAAAKSLQSAKETEESAKRSREAAEAQFEDTTKEVEEAKKFLEETEERCEVIEIDDEMEEEEDEETESGGDVKEIVVWGCGFAGVNGRYKRRGKQRGAPIFRKDATDADIWKGFYIARNGLGVWNIYENQFGSRYEHGSENPLPLPPKTGWKVRYGCLPAPQLDW